MREIRAHRPRQRIGRANVILVASPRVSSHFFNSVLADSDLAILNRPESFHPVVEKIIELSAEALGLLPSEIAKAKRRILISPFQLRSAREMQARDQVSKRGLERSQASWGPRAWSNRQGSERRQFRANFARFRKKTGPTSVQPAQPPPSRPNPPFSSAFCEVSMGCGDFSF